MIPQGQGFLFIFHPTPSRLLSLICGPHIIPRPRAWEGRAMISICRACSHTICRQRIGLSRLTRSRSFDYSKSVCGSSAPFRQARRLSDTGQRDAWRCYLAGGIFDIPRACGLAFIFPPIRYGRRGDDATGVSICGRYRWRTAEAHVGGVFYFDTIPFSFTYAVPFCSSLVRYEKRDGGLFVVPRPVICR